MNSSIALFTLEQKNRTIINSGWRREVGTIIDKDGTPRRIVFDQFQTYAEPIGRVVSKGFEIEIAGDLTENWKLFLGYTYNKSKYKNADEANAIHLNSEGKKGSLEFGDATPVQMFRLGTSYHIPNTKFTIGGSISAQSDTTSYYGIKQAGYTLLDGFVQYEFTPNARLGIIGTNLTDKTYFENNYNRTRGMNNFYGRPRTFMMKFDWSF